MSVESDVASRIPDADLVGPPFLTWLDKDTFGPIYKLQELDIKRAQKRENTAAC